MAAPLFLSPIGLVPWRTQQRQQAPRTPHRLRQAHRPLRRHVSIQLGPQGVLVLAGHSHADPSNVQTQATTRRGSPCRVPPE